MPLSYSQRETFAGLVSDGHLSTGFVRLLLHIDPAIEVLATTRYPTVDGPHAANGQVDVPVIWTKRWGMGRIFYCSLGHHADVLEPEPVRTIMRRGFLWAAEGKEIAQKKREAVSMEAMKRMF